MDVFIVAHLLCSVVAFISVIASIKNCIADNDPLFRDLTLVSKHKSKQFEYNNSAFDAAMLEAITKENQNGTLSDVNNRNDNAARLASDINDTRELQCTMVVEGVAPCTGSSIEMKLLERDRILYADEKSSENEVIDENEFRKMELFKNDTDLYTDKSVMESDLPELMVCYKDSTYHVVKDICIDV